MDELLEQFLIEGRELVQRAADDLLALARDGADAARIDSAFRAVHTLKGSVGFFDFAAMGVALHAAEDVLGAVRAGRLTADRAVIDALLDCVGACDAWVEAIARTGSLPTDAEAQGRQLRDTLSLYLEDKEGRTGPPTAIDRSWLPALLARDPEAVAKAVAGGRPLTGLRYAPDAGCFFRGEDPLALVRSIPDLIVLYIESGAAGASEDFDPFTCTLVFEALTTAPAAEIRRIFDRVADQALIEEVGAEHDISPDAERQTGLAEAATDSAARTLRVDAARIDGLVDIVGELIVAKNGLSHLAAQAAAMDPHLARALSARQAEIERLVGDMHRAVMGVRMTPLARTLRRFPRVVREIAAKLGKDVDFHLRGEEVEADKSIVDGLFEPLLHLLRNAVDHGIEGREARVAAGKPATGRITFEARREGDQIVITVADDGAGIDLAKIRSAAKARHLMSDAAIDALDDRAAAELIFAPGFSTAAAVTDVSGRGVGLDAVRMAVEALGGRVALTSLPGAGATVRLTLPQAVVITTVMTVRVGEERYGVPIEAVVETARIADERILPIRSGEAFALRDRTIPLVRLSALLGLAPSERRADAKVLIVAAGEHRVGVEVDGFGERFDALLRPMTGLLSGMPGVLGATLLGDGRVLMVLDLPELIG